MVRFFRLDNLEKMSCDIKSAEDLIYLLAEIENVKLEKNLTININLPKYDKETVAQILKASQIAKARGSSVTVLVNSKTMQFKASELENFAELEDVFFSEKVNLRFDGGRDDYSLSETLSAQLQIDEIIERINQTKASPLEKYLMAYEYVSSRVYKENPENFAKSRDLIALFNGDDIVCVGYAKLMERICMGIGIECLAQASQISDASGNELGGHQNNLVYLKDEKYGIDGYYYSDACWDAVSKDNKQKRTLNYCLIPLSDKDKFKDTKVDIDENIKLNDVSLKYFYTQIPTKYDLLKTYDIDELKMDMFNDSPIFLEAAKRELLSEQKRLKACEVFVQLLKKNNIPANVYGDEDGKIEFLPLEYSYEYILALLMEDSPNVEEIEKCITALKNYSSNKGVVGYVDDGVVFRVASDIYKKLEELSKSKTVERTNTENVNEKYYEPPFSWRNIGEKLYEINLAGGMVSKISNAVKVGSVIPLEVYEHALINMFLAQGFDEKTSKSRAKTIIEDTIKNSDNVFKGSATNSFYEELNRRKLLDSGELGE